MGSPDIVDNVEHRLDRVIECVWLFTIFIIPVCFLPFALNSFYFVKSLVQVFLVCLLVGLVIAQRLLAGGHMGGAPLSGSYMKKYPLQIAATASGLLWIIATVFSIMPYKSFWGNLAGSVGLLPNLGWIIFFLIVAARIRKRAQIFRALYALLISSAIVCLIGIMQYIDPHVLPWFPFYGRVFSIDGNPLSLSGFVAMTLPITLALAILSRYGSASGKKSNVLFAGLLVLAVIQFCCLALAQYSVTLLLFIVGIFSFFALTGVFLQRKATIGLSMIFLLVIAVIAGVLVGPMLVSETATAPPGDNQAVVSTADQIGLPTLSIRVAAWKSALAIIIDSPDVPFSGDNYHWLRRAIGYGPEALIAVSQTRFPDVLKSQYTFESLVISQPENHYLYLGTTVGILGLLVFLSILAAFFYKGFRLLMKTGDRETILLSAAFIAAILQYCVHILFNASVIDPELVFWLVMASTVALVRLEEEKAVGTESAGAPGGDESGAVKSAGNLRNAVAVLALLGFASLGLYLTVPPLLANMKIQSGLSLLRSDKQAALTMYQDATKIEPRQSYYFNFVGNLAYIMAKGESDPGEKTKFLSISEGAYLKAIEREPEMAIWRYRLADIDVFWSENGDRSKMDQALSLYKEADTIFPGNAVILNKWAFALILKGDHDAARAKLEESQKSDPNWIQTAFFKGYIEASRGNLGEAANLFLTPQQNKLNDVRFFTNFCSLLAQYKGVQPVSGALESKVNAGASDWVGYAFLGIAEAYNGDFEGAVRAFSNAAGLVPQESKPLLGGTIQAVFIGSGPYEKTGQEIIQKLMGSQPGIR